MVISFVLLTHANGSVFTGIMLVFWLMMVMLLDHDRHMPVLVPLGMMVVVQRMPHNPATAQANHSQQQHNQTDPSGDSHSNLQRPGTRSKPRQRRPINARILAAMRQAAA